MQNTTVLIVDDFAPFRQSVCSTLEQKPEFRVVSQASDGLEAVLEANRTQPDLVVLDVGLPKLNGIEAARQILEVAPGAKIVCLSQETSPDIVEEAIGSGASAYVAKHSAATDLLEAIEAVLEGKQYVSTMLGPDLITEVRAAAD